MYVRINIPKYQISNVVKNICKIALKLQYQAIASIFVYMGHIISWPTNKHDPVRNVKLTMIRSSGTTRLFRQVDYNTYTIITVHLISFLYVTE